MNNDGCDVHGNGDNDDDGVGSFDDDDDTDNDEDDDDDDDAAVSCVACERPFEGSYCIKVTLDNWEGAGILS